MIISHTSPLRNVTQNFSLFYYKKIEENWGGNYEGWWAKYLKKKLFSCEGNCNNKRNYWWNCWPTVQFFIICPTNLLTGKVMKIYNFSIPIFQRPFFVVAVDDNDQRKFFNWITFLTHKTILLSRDNEAQINICFLGYLRNSNIMKEHQVGPFWCLCSFLFSC